jgi:hypothetical protein
MDYMLCRNRVRNFDRWKRVFDSHAGAHRAAGLTLVHLWQCIDNPSQVFFLFEVEDVQRARAFVKAEDASQTAREAGLIEGEIHFFRGSRGYGAVAVGSEEQARASK